MDPGGRRVSFGQPPGLGPDTRTGAEHCPQPGQLDQQREDKERKDGPSEHLSPPAQTGSSTLRPHSLQNLALAPSWAPQSEQKCAIWAPHSLQNLAPALIS